MPEDKATTSQAGHKHPLRARGTGFWPTAILIVFAVLVAVLFYHVVRPFIFPVFFAAILAVLFRPTHEWLTRVCRGHRRIAAAATMIGVLLGVVLPLTGALLLAGVELLQTGRDLLDASGLSTEQVAGPQMQSIVQSKIDSLLSSYFSKQQISQMERELSRGVDGLTSTVYKRTQSLLADAVMFVFGGIVMILGFYYLLIDGEKAASEISSLIPLNIADQRVLFARFETVCRGVVIGTVVSGVSQGILAGIGFALVGVERIWLLSLLTIFFSFTPLLGAAMIWLTVVLSLLVGERYLAALLLSFYGTFVISLADNFIKAYVIGDRSQMHPFVIFVTVLGALHFVGLWGIFLGPLTAAFFFALLTSVRRNLDTEASVGQAGASKGALPN